MQQSAYLPGLMLSHGVTQCVPGAGRPDHFARLSSPQSSFSDRLYFGVAYEGQSLSDKMLVMNRRSCILI